MSEQELKKYRLTSLEDPSDEQLEALMQAAGDAARKRSAETEAHFLSELNRIIAEKQNKSAHKNGESA